MFLIRKMRGEIVDETLIKKNERDKELVSQPRLGSEVDYARGRY